MNHVRRDQGVSFCTALKNCHPERSRAQSEANRQPQSKDPVFAHSGSGSVGSFRIAVRFFDDHDNEIFHELGHQANEVLHEPSHEANEVLHDPAAKRR